MKKLTEKQIEEGQTRNISLIRDLGNIVDSAKRDIAKKTSWTSEELIEKEKYFDDLVKKYTPEVYAAIRKYEKRGEYIPDR